MKIAENQVYFVREIESMFHSFKSDTDTVSKNGQQYGHKENIRMPLFWETVLALQGAIPHLKFQIKYHFINAQQYLMN